jgi:hypothetical protein
MQVSRCRPESVETRRLLTKRNVKLNHWALRFARAHIQFRLKKSESRYFLIDRISSLMVIISRVR